MRRIPEMIGDLIAGDPRVLIGVLVALALVVGGIVYAKLTRARRLRAQARVIRRR